LLLLLTLCDCHCMWHISCCKYFAVLLKYCRLKFRHCSKLLKTGGTAIIGIRLLQMSDVILWMSTTVRVSDCFCRFGVKVQLTLLHWWCRDNGINYANRFFSIMCWFWLHLHCYLNCFLGNQMTFSCCCADCAININQSVLLLHRLLVST